MCRGRRRHTNLGVSVVERPLCVAAFAPVAEVPLACCPSRALVPQSLCPLTSLWLSPVSVGSIALAGVGRARCGSSRFAVVSRVYCGVWATIVKDSESTRPAVGSRTGHPRCCRCCLTTGLCPVVVSFVRRYRTVSCRA